MHMDTVLHSEVDTEIIILVTGNTALARTETDSLNRFQPAEPSKYVDIMYMLLNNMVAG